MESARLTYEYNRTNYERDRKLHEKQLISDYEYQTSLKEYEVSKTAYEKAQADRVRAAKNLNYAEIYSPIDGVVISREVEVGQTVVSSMNVQNLYVIADLDNMQVVGNVDEADIGQVKMGQRATFTVDAYPDDRFEGEVTQVRLNPTTESNVVTYEVIVAAPNPDHKLIPGLTANLSINVTEEKGVLAVPNRALRFTPREFPDAKGLPQPEAMPDAPKDAPAGTHTVWTVRGDRLVPVQVTTGESNGNVTQVLSGLSEGETVALEYDTAAMAAPEGADGGNTEQSPFAPRPPHKKK